MNILLSALDLSPISAGQGDAGAVRDTVELAQLAERLGYHRYWAPCPAVNIVGIHWLLGSVD